MTFSRIHALRPLAAVALLAIAGQANATITVYTSLAAFQAAVGTTGTDTFAGLSISGETASPLNRSAGSYTYTATGSGNTSTSGDNNFWGGGTTANPFLSTNIAGVKITFSNFSNGVVAIGGNFFASNVSGLYTAGGVKLVATDASGSVTQTISPTGATAGSFLGFVSDGPITSLALNSVIVSSALWPSADNLVLANAAAPVPEPQTYALLLGGLGLVGFIAGRRRRPA